MVLINRFRAGCLAFSSILLLTAIACNTRLQEPTPEPLLVTPVAFQPRVPTVEPTAFPRLEERPTPTPTPWPIAFATHPPPTATATPLSVLNAAPTPRSRPASIPTPTKIYRWTQIQRDYRDKRITYNQAVEQAVDAGISRPHARIALSQIRMP